VGDIHGDYDRLIKILRHAKLIDRRNNWIGKDSILIQVGDLIDRADDTIKIFDILMKLRDQAKEVGGIVNVLIGNHELMALQGNYVFASIGDFDSFGGLENREKEFSLEGKYGEFIRKQMNVSMIIDDTIFCHSGISSNFLEQGIDYLNDYAHDLFTNIPPFDELYDSVVLQGKNHPIYTDPLVEMSGPLWSSGFVSNAESKACPEIEKVLNMTNTKRMVIGHTVQNYGQIKTRCDNKLIIIDIGISSCIGGYYGYLEILNNE
ncbi:Metallo-dependent phosphatase, partial [Anaeromyces robustus]